MRRLWQALALGTLGVAAYQWLCLCEWFVEGARFGRLQVMSPKQGVVYAFPLLVVASASMAAFTARCLRTSSPEFARCGRAAIYLLAGGLALSEALMASPLLVVLYR